MRNKILITVCLITAVCGFQAFAEGSRETTSENELWYLAADIVKSSASVLPVEKRIVWEELSPTGKTVSTDEVVFFYGETEGSVNVKEKGEYNDKYVYGQRLKIDYVGDADIINKRNSINDGLFWTPFDDDVKSSDVTVVNTGSIVSINGTECLVFEYTLYRDPATSGYDFKETIYDDYEDSESSIDNVIKGRAWIDGNGILRQLESRVSGNVVKSSHSTGYCETVQYDYDGTTIYPVKSIIEGAFGSSDGDIIVQTSFRATEIMSDFWIATDFYR